MPNTGTERPRHVRVYVKTSRAQGLGIAGGGGTCSEAGLKIALVVAKWLRGLAADA